MGERVIDYCAKGPICYCLDEFSKGRGARARVARLHGALVALRPAFEGLAEVFNEHLLSHVISNADARARALEYLESWFNPSSAGDYFPAVPVASIYGEGVIKALELV